MTPGAPAPGPGRDAGDVEVSKNAADRPGSAPIDASAAPHATRG
jgi:hypothetical protein